MNSQRSMCYSVFEINQEKNAEINLDKNMKCNLK